MLDYRFSYLFSFLELFPVYFKFCKERLKSSKDLSSFASTVFTFDE